MNTLSGIILFLCMTSLISIVFYTDKAMMKRWQGPPRISLKTVLLDGFITWPYLFLLSFLEPRIDRSRILTRIIVFISWAIPGGTAVFAITGKAWYINIGILFLVSVVWSFSYLFTMKLMEKSEG